MELMLINIDEGIAFIIQGLEAMGVQVKQLKEN